MCTARNSTRPASSRPLFPGKPAHRIRRQCASQIFANPSLTGIGFVPPFFIARLRSAGLVRSALAVPARIRKMRLPISCDPRNSHTLRSLTHKQKSPRLTEAASPEVHPLIPRTRSRAGEPGPRPGERNPPLAGIGFVQPFFVPPFFTARLRSAGPVKSALAVPPPIRKMRHPHCEPHPRATRLHPGRCPTLATELPRATSPYIDNASPPFISCKFSQPTGAKTLAPSIAALMQTETSVWSGI